MIVHKLNYFIQSVIKDFYYLLCIVRYDNNMFNILLLFFIIKFRSYYRDLFTNLRKYTIYY